MSVCPGIVRYSFWYSCCTEMSVGHGTAQYVVSGSSFIYLYPSALWIKTQILSKMDICVLDNTLLTWTTQFLCPLLKRMQLTCSACVILAMTVGRKHIDPAKKLVSITAWTVILIYNNAKFKFMHSSNHKKKDVLFHMHKTQLHSSQMYF